MFTPYPHGARLPDRSAFGWPQPLITHKVVHGPDDPEDLTHAELLLWTLREEISWTQVAPRRHLAGLALGRDRTVKQARLLDLVAEFSIVRFRTGDTNAVTVLFKDNSLLLGRLDTETDTGHFFPFGLNFRTFMSQSRKAVVAEREGASWLATRPGILGFRAPTMPSFEPLPDAFRAVSDAGRDTHRPWWWPIITCTSADVRFIERLLHGVALVIGARPDTTIEDNVSLSVSGLRVTREGPAGEVTLRAQLDSGAPGPVPRHGDGSAPTALYDSLLKDLRAAFAHPSFPVPRERLLRHDSPIGRSRNAWKLAIITPRTLRYSSNHERLVALDLARTWLVHGRDRRIEHGEAHERLDFGHAVP